jgi:hypothetical protein
MRRGFVFAFATVTVLAVLSSTPAFAQPPAATPPVVVQPLAPTPTPPPRTVVVQPAPETVVQPAPGTVVLQPAPGVVVQPGAPPVGTPLTCPEPRGAMIQGQRYLPPSVSVCIPGPPNYGPGPFLVSRYNALSGPPYAMPAFTAGNVPVGPGGLLRANIFIVSPTLGKHSYIALTSTTGAAFPHKNVDSVKDVPNNISFGVVKTWLKSGDKVLIIKLEGKGRGERPPVDGGDLTVTLAPSPPPPPVPTVPVIYVDDP